MERARQFQNRAEECLRVAELAWSDEVRDRYRAKAGAYTALAETELVLANGFEQELKHPRPANHPPPHDKAEPPLPAALVDSRETADRFNRDA